MKEEKAQAHTADGKTRMVVMTALLAALACVATMVIRIPSPTGGYLNLGDTVVLLGAFLLGPLYGAVAGGIGSMLADLLSGYMIYAPATLVIKAGMAVVAGVLYRAARGVSAARFWRLSWVNCRWWWDTGYMTRGCWGASREEPQEFPAIWCRRPLALWSPRCWPLCCGKTAAFAQNFQIYKHNAD